jgi:hypothetical protein
MRSLPSPEYRPPVFDQTIFSRSRDLSDAPADVRTARILAAVRLVLVALPCLWAIGAFFPPLNHDVAALLQFAERMLHGERLYVDLVDINPPAIFVLDAVPVALAEALGLPVVPTFISAVLALCALSFWLSTGLLTRLGEGRRALGGLLWPAVLAFVLVGYPLHSFGQREHLLLIFTLPYALAAAARADGHAPPARLVTGTALFVLLGITLKPYFALVPLALELLVLARAGWGACWRSSAPWLILGACVAYVIAVRAWLPEYFTVVLPLVAQCYEQLDAATMLGLFTKDQVPALLLPLIPLAVIAFRLPEARLSRVMACFTLAATGAGILQGKGWDYHFFAARAGLVLTFGAVIVDGLSRLARASVLAGALRTAAPIGIAVSVMAAIFAFSGVLNPPFKGPRNFVNTAASRFLPVVQANAADRPVLWLTTSIYPQFPVLDYTHSPLAMPFMSLWMLPALYGPESASNGSVHYRAPAAMDASERLVWRGVVDAFVRQKPALVIVEDARREGAFRGLPFDYLAYFTRDPAFAGEWAHYAPLTTVDNATIYRRR